MARTTPSDPARGNALRAIAIASAVIYTVFTVIATSGGSESSYQTPLWATWTLVMLVAATTFAIGAAMHRGAKSSAINGADQAPALTLVS